MEEFRLRIIEMLEDIFKEQYVIEPVDMTKINDTQLHGIAVRAAEGCCGMTIYLDEHYRLHTDGMELQDIVDSLASAIRKESKQMDEISSQLHRIAKVTDYESVKESIMFRVLNADRNKEYLKNIVCFPTGLDINMCLYLDVEFESGKGGIINLTKQIRDMWNVSDEELLEQAKKNTQEKRPPMFANVQTLLYDTEFDGLPCDMNLYVLTNKEKTDGAGVIFYEGLLKEYSERLEGKNFIILPSSIHETLLIPTDELKDVTYLRRMVCSINAMELQPGEVLSDNIYYYNKETDSVRIVDEEEE